MKADMKEYDFIDKFTKSLSASMPIDTSEMIYLLEVKKQEHAYMILLGIGAMGIGFLALVTYWA
jgi:hypothetical protein